MAGCDGAEQSGGLWGGVGFGRAGQVGQGSTGWSRVRQARVGLTKAEGGSGRENCGGLGQDDGGWGWDRWGGVAWG